MPLEVATEGCCQGHKCDNCATCKRGRCCRKDNPDYQLPKLGEWDGPIYGELGVLNDEGDKVECHCCGEWFITLAAHVWYIHGLMAAEYKAIFGLNRRTSLAAPTYTTKRRQIGKEIRAKYGPLIPPPFTPEQLSSFTGNKPRRLQDLMHPSQHQGVKRQGSSLYVGVWRKGSSWVAKITFTDQTQKSKGCYIGAFRTQEAAARAYDAKARELYGDKARLNFPDTEAKRHTDGSNT